VVKFNKTPFNQVDSKHDELMLKTISDEGIDIVIKTIGFLDRAVPSGNVGMCRRDCIKKVNGMCFGRLNTFGVNCSIDKHGYVNYIKGKYEPVETTYIGNLDDEYGFDFETEMLCTPKSSVIGYVDVLIQPYIGRNYKASIKGMLDNIPVPNMYSEDIIVEVKPEIKDAGAILRQLKTYRELLYNMPDDWRSYPKYRREYISMVVTTNSNVSPAIKDYLLHEGVHVIKF
jgi:hypothetical protein